MASKPLIIKAVQIQSAEVGPETLSALEIEHFFTLDEDELPSVRERRGPLNRLALALLIGFLKMTGRRRRYFWWAAKALLANPDIGVTQIAHRLGVSPATLYRYIPAARTAKFADV